LAAVEVIWQVVSSWFRRDWVPSRAIAWREVSRFSEAGRSRGLGSLARMLPRSKVYGVGLETVMGLLSVGVSIGGIFFDSLDLRVHFDIG
jgi:hypothetical protein